MVICNSYVSLPEGNLSLRLMDPQMRTAQMDMDGKVERGDPEYTVGRTSNYQKKQWPT